MAAVRRLVTFYVAAHNGRDPAFGVPRANARRDVFRPRAGAFQNSSRWQGAGRARRGGRPIERCHVGSAQRRAVRPRRRSQPHEKSATGVGDLRALVRKAVRNATVAAGSSSSLLVEAIRPTPPDGGDRIRFPECLAPLALLVEFAYEEMPDVLRISRAVSRGFLYSTQLSREMRKASQLSVSKDLIWRLESESNRR